MLIKYFPAGVFVFAVFGLQFGSFLDVLVHRWGQAGGQPRLSLSHPSHCVHCQTRLRWVELVPLFSFVWLKGRCRHCQAPISWRCPLNEFLLALLWSACAARWGLSGEALAWAAWATCLLALVWLAWQTLVLPAALVLPLAPLGVALAAAGVIQEGAWLASLAGALAGALAGWAGFRMAWGAQHRPAQQGLLALLAGLGAWLGWAVLPVLALQALALAWGAHRAWAPVPKVLSRWLPLLWSSSGGVWLVLDGIHQ